MKHFRRFLRICGEMCDSAGTYCMVHAHLSMLDLFVSVLLLSRSGRQAAIVSLPVLAHLHVDDCTARHDPALRPPCHFLYAALLPVCPGGSSTTPGEVQAQELKRPQISQYCIQLLQTRTVLDTMTTMHARVCGQQGKFWNSIYF